MKHIPCTLSCSPPDFMADDTVIESVNIAIERAAGLRGASIAPLTPDQIIDEPTAYDAVRLGVERQRLCYWLVRACGEAELPTDVQAGIAAALAVSGYPLGSRIANQLLAMGEPGRHLTADRPCGSCGGSGKRYGKSLSGARQPCASCKGSGSEG